MQIDIDKSKHEKGRFSVRLEGKDFDYVASNNRFFFTTTKESIEKLVAFGQAALQDAELTKEKI